VSSLEMLSELGPTKNPMDLRAVVVICRNIDLFISMACALTLGFDFN